MLAIAPTPQAPIGTLRTLPKGWCVARRGQTREQVEQRLRQGEWLQSGEAAKLLGRDRKTVIRWIVAGRTPSGQRLRHRVNGSYRECHPEDLAAVLASTREIHEGVPRD